MGRLVNLCAHGPLFACAATHTLWSLLCAERHCPVSFCVCGPHFDARNGPRGALGPGGPETGRTRPETHRRRSQSRGPGRLRPAPVQTARGTPVPGGAVQNGCWASPCVASAFLPASQNRQGLEGGGPKRGFLHPSDCSGLPFRRSLQANRHHLQANRRQLQAN